MYEFNVDNNTIQLFYHEHNHQCTSETQAVNWIVAMAKFYKVKLSVLFNDLVIVAPVNVVTAIITNSENVF